MKTSVVLEVRNYREQEIEFRDTRNGGALSTFVKRTLTGIDSDGQICIVSLARNCHFDHVPQPGEVVELSWAKAEQKDGLWLLGGCGR